jgi:tetratricopeptide (TPR) repeat protein
MEKAQEHFDAARQAHLAGRLAEAADHYRRCLAAAPDNAPTLFFLGRLYQETGRPAEARRLLDDALARFPKSAAIWEAQGQLHDQAGDLAAAIAAFETAVGLDPQAPAPLVELGICLARKGAAADAVPVLRRALALAPQDPVVHLNLGQALAASGDSDAAEQHYRQSLTLDPRFAPAFSALAQLLRQQGRAEAALDHFRRGLALQPKDPVTLNSLAALYQDLGQMEAAVARYRDSLGVAAHPVTFAKLAAVLERAHRLDEAESVAQKALALQPGNAEARLVAAKLALRHGDKAAAASRYRSLIDALSRQAPLRDRAILARAQADLAALQEKAGAFDEAFALYDAANRTNREGHPGWQAESTAYLERVERLTAMLAAADGAAADRATTACEEATPVFLVGFPRSGTTLADQLLNAHSKLAVMEEKPILDRLSAELGGPEEARLGLVRALPADELAALRQRYWALAAQHCSLEPGQELVDKLPLNILNLWLIQALFPQAKILLALRDPRDVCLSCFTNLFRLGAGLAGFPTLESAARLYAAVMRHWLTAQARLPLNSHVFRYEDMIEDLAGEAKGLIAFLGLPWEDSVLDYRSKAEQRYIVTPSYHQVVQPLYSSSLARWRRYPEAWAPVQPILAPFIERFGYDRT